MTRDDTASVLCAPPSEPSYDGNSPLLGNREKLTEAIEAGGFLEHAMVHGNLYGTSFDAIRRVQESKKICILDIDAQVSGRCRPGLLVF